MQNVAHVRLRSFGPGRMIEDCGVSGWSAALRVMKKAGKNKLIFPEPRTTRVSPGFLRDILEEAADFGFTFHLWGESCWWDTWANIITDTPGVLSLNSVFHYVDEVFPAVEMHIYRRGRKVNIPLLRYVIKWSDFMAWTDHDIRYIVGRIKSQGHDEIAVYNDIEDPLMPVRCSTTRLSMPIQFWWWNREEHMSVVSRSEGRWSIHKREEP